MISDGIGAFDAELGNFQAAGQIINQVYQRITYEASDIMAPYVPFEAPPELLLSRR